MIAFMEPLPIGNAVRVLLAPAPGATKTRVLRKLTDDIADESDPNAANVYEGDERWFVDIRTLTNGTVYYYRSFDLVEGAWVASPSAHATPAAVGQSYALDVLELVRERLEAAFKTDVQVNRLRHAGGYVPCYSAPPEAGNIQWPVFSVHLRNDAPAYRGVGEIVAPDELVDEDEIEESEGWIARVQLDIVGWSQNADERIALRKALKRAVIGNLPVFAAAGMDLVELSVSDSEDFESYGQPVFQAVGSLSCIAPALFAGTQPVANEVTVLAQAA